MHFNLKLKFIAIFALFVVLNNGGVLATGDYYWREWNGTIPIDAIPGGFQDGDTTYIGRTYFPESNGIIVTTIKKNSDQATGHLGPFFLTTAARTQILCSSDNEQTSWKTVNLDTMFSTDCKFVKGGFFESTDLYIGRRQFDSNILLGQIFPVGHKFQGFETWNNGHVGPIKDFEALAYCGHTPTNTAIKVPVSCVSCLT